MDKTKVLEVEQIIDRDGFAEQLVNWYYTNQQHRAKWLEEKRELRNYIFATSTKTTTNKSLPWKNSTTTPKLTQLRDNLHANYMAALFPNDNWFDWIGAEQNAEKANKKAIIKQYMKVKTDNSDFKEVVSRLVYDYIDYGNAFATVEYVTDRKDVDGEKIDLYVGPKLVRVSPLDIVFNPIASSFDNTPKAIRSVATLGDLKKQIESNPTAGYKADILAKMRDTRLQSNSYSEADFAKDEALQIDGFGSLKQYYGSGYVEIIDFFGDFYDVTTDTLYADHVITVVDRSYIIRMEPNKNWLGHKAIRHVGWRLRPDNLYAMGPLDNLVGMQYRIDHLENLKADVFDLIAFPPLKVRGQVEDFEWGPMERIYIGDEGDVAMLVPDAQALAADMQINLLENKMEELAGAPKQAMGIRTPGEKTAYEVQQLENAAGRIFQNKVTYFESQFLEPLLNAMLAEARRVLDSKDVIRVVDNDLGAVKFLEITKEDITAKGMFRPQGARHFAAKATLIQNLTNFMASPLGQDPGVRVHFSGLKAAKIAEEAMNLEQYKLVSENIALIEQAKTQKFAESIQEQVDIERQVPTTPTPEDFQE